MITSSVRGIPIPTEDVIEGKLDRLSNIVPGRIMTVDEELLKPIGRVSERLLQEVLRQVKENF